MSTKYASAPGGGRGCGAPAAVAPRSRAPTAPDHGEREEEDEHRIDRVRVARHLLTDVGQSLHVEEERPVVGRRAHVELVRVAERAGAVRGGEVGPLELVGATGANATPSPRSAASFVICASSSGGERLVLHEHRAEERIEDVTSEHDDDVLLRMLDTVATQRLEGEHGRAQRLVADELVAPRDREDAAGRKVVEVLLERLDGVEVVLAQCVRGRAAGAQRVGEADLDLVVEPSPREDRPAVTDRRVHAGQRVRRAREDGSSYRPRSGGCPRSAR